MLRVSVTYKGYGFWDNPVYVVYLGSKRVLEDDIIQMVGLGTGTISYESTLGGKITIPSLLVSRFMSITK